MWVWVVAQLGDNCCCFGQSDFSTCLSISIYPCIVSLSPNSLQDLMSLEPLLLSANKMGNLIDAPEQILFKQISTVESHEASPMNPPVPQQLSTAREIFTSLVSFKLGLALVKLRFLQTHTGLFFTMQYVVFPAINHYVCALLRSWSPLCVFRRHSDFYVKRSAGVELIEPPTQGPSTNQSFCSAESRWTRVRPHLQGYGHESNFAKIAAVLAHLSRTSPPYSGCNPGPDDPCDCRRLRFLVSSVPPSPSSKWNTE